MCSSQQESDYGVCLFDIDDYFIQTELENIHNSNDTTTDPPRYNMFWLIFYRFQRTMFIDFQTC